MLVKTWQLTASRQIVNLTTGLLALTVTTEVVAKLLLIHSLSQGAHDEHK